MNQLIFYFAFAIGTFASSCFLYSIVIFCQTLDAVKGFSGIVFFFLFLPFPIFFLYTGYLLDHYSKKWVVVSFQFFLFISSFLLGAFTDFFHNHPLLLLPLAFVNGIGMTTVLPGRMAILREVMESHRLVFHTIAGNLLLIFAFGMSPLAVGWFREGNDYPSLFLVLASFHLLSMIAFTSLRYNAKIQNPGLDSKGSKLDRIPSLSENLKTVLEFLKVDSVSRQVMYMAVLSMLALGPIQVILPKYVRTELGLGELARGTVLVFLGPGLFLGGVLTILFHHLERKGLVLLIVFTLSSIFFLGFVPFGKAFTTSLFLFCFGVSGGVVSSLLPAILQKRAEDGIRGRILSLYTVCFQFTPAVSGFLSALLADTIGSQLTFGILGGLFLCFALFSFLQYKELRES
ncbi:transporter, major facilitator family protein [Leptospira wolbachii serovar Codice str. CDC]|uniref:Transporter, major facilitator family protein n=1 Tax=Leptospira wolbachii serovar Codice str. CDC TaxID=1218599 RepID=R8ZZW9_9LEPT|nr:MFS transporter [Leptospira wolbachii]EOQ95259.1 transporter, major facilitator family protein [Leptospira wolbachii serovar Codice str. CDC]